jgi:hypothetical protein
MPSSRRPSGSWPPIFTLPAPPPPLAVRRDSQPAGPQHSSRLTGTADSVLCAQPPWLVERQRPRPAARRLPPSPPGAAHLSSRFMEGQQPRREHVVSNPSRMPHLVTPAVALAVLAAPLRHLWGCSGGMCLSGWPTVDFTLVAAPVHSCPAYLKRGYLSDCLAWMLYIETL